MAYDAYKVTKAMERMFRACPLPLTNNGDPDEAQKMAAMYLEACDGYTTGAIVDACEDFTFGRVQGVNRAWAPRVPQFSEHLRSVQSHLSGHKSLHSAAIKQIEARDRDAEIEAARTPESMAKVRKMVSEFANSVSEDKRTPEEMERMREIMRKTDEHFAGDFIAVIGGRPVSVSLAKKLSYETFNSADDDKHDMGGLK